MFVQLQCTLASGHVMNAKTQYKLTSADLEVLLALVRCGNLAAAAERLGVDASTVFRSVGRIEKGMGQRLFERTKQGYLPLELVRVLAEHAELIEAQLESARSAAQLEAGEVSGEVRITTTDTILQGLIVPVLKSLCDKHPMLRLELHTSHELVNLTRRDADIAVRATREPPPHLVGKHLGPLHFAMYAGSNSAVQNIEDISTNMASWIDPSNLRADHPLTLWRMRNLPKVVPQYRVNDFLAVRSLIEFDLGIGMLPTFLAQGRTKLKRLTDTLEECRTELWLLTHPESRHLLRVSTVFNYLSTSLDVRGIAH